MTQPTEGHGLQESGPFATPDRSHETLGRTAHGHHVVSIDHVVRKAVGRGEAGGGVGRLAKAVVHVAREEVVLGDEENVGTQDLGQVQRFLHRALFHRPVPEVRDGDVVGAPQLSGQAAADGQRHRARHDRNRPVEPVRSVPEMHGSAHATGHAGVLPENLGEQRSNAAAERQHVRVGPVRAEDHVRAAEMLRDAEERTR